MSEKKKLTYSKAIKELESIVYDIETENIDVDALTEKVKRATDLIKFCKRSLRTTEEEVKKALTEIEEKRDSEPGGSEVADSGLF